MNEFFPKYMKVVKNYSNLIMKVRAEGHISSEWGVYESDEAYFNNMRLS